MSYASECLARGRTMVADTAQGLRERRPQRWALFLPVAVFGAIFLGILSIPSLMVCGDFPIDFVFWYSLVALASFIAPAGKRLIATLLTCLAALYCHWIINQPSDGDPDAPTEAALLLGSMGGSGLALALTLFQVRSRWMLVLPAYFLGFGALFWATVLVGSCMMPLLPTTGWIPATFSYTMTPLSFILPLLAANLFAVKTAPSHHLRVMGGTILLTLAAVISASCNWGF